MAQAWLLLDAPSPTGINQFPESPKPIVKTWILKHVDMPAHLLGLGGVGPFGIHIGRGAMMDFRQKSILTVSARWKKVAAATASKITPYSHKISMTRGSTITDVETKSISATMGVAGDIASMSASISDTVSHTVTFTKIGVTTETLQLVPLDDNKHSVIWWQPVYDWKVSSKFYHGIGNGAYSPDSFFDSNSSKWTHSEPEFITTSFPA